MEELRLWDKRILVFSTTGGKAQELGQTLPPSFGAQGKAASVSPHTTDTGFPEDLHRGNLWPLPSHPALQAIQRQDSGETRKREGWFELGEEGGTGLQNTLSPQIAPLGRRGKHPLSWENYFCPEG